MKSIHLTLYLNSSLSRDVLPGIARFARERGDWKIVAYPHLPQPGQEKIVDGLIGVLGRQSQRELDHLSELGVPIVCLSGFDPPEGIPLVTHDDRAIGRMAAEHLVNKGFVRFAYAHIPQAANATDRLNGFQERLAQLGMPQPQVWGVAENRLGRRIKDAEKPLGVFAANDNRARHLENACRVAGVEIPGELGLVGVDNDAVQCELCPVPLSSIILQFDQVGWEAASLLHRMMDGELLQETVRRLPPVKVEERLSTDPLLVEDPLARRALARMKATLGNWHGVDALAQELGISKRLLEQRFRKATGDSIYQKLQRMRMEAAARLLGETPLPVSEVAERVGFSDVNRFGTCFRAATGMTPTGVRKSGL
jgi:LacI family transcriptional regulator